MRVNYNPWLRVDMPPHPDQIHIDQIRTALWRGDVHGDAALMVGAGMSLNARPRLPSVPRFPTWDQLMIPVIEQLYPAHSHPDTVQQRLRIQAAAASSALRLASEYVAAFGEGSLEQLIRSAIPDDDYLPSDLHDRLLRLRWADVFTTNWDTLLERAAISAQPGHYGVVRAAADLPQCRRPRIVKLHGSLPATRPFILTEDHFRTYPDCYAPFVNTVRQAIMENVFCLIGFSGSDPNFLQWSGWVRDQLGPQRPFIYLISIEPLLSAQRALLMERRVVPIDLSSVFPSSEPDREAKAVEWFLINLEAGRPPSARRWPSRAVAPPHRAHRPLRNAEFTIYDALGSAVTV